MSRSNDCLIFKSPSHLAGSGRVATRRFKKLHVFSAPFSAKRRDNTGEFSLKN